jgi:hypothetical protein
MASAESTGTNSEIKRCNMENMKSLHGRCFFSLLPKKEK